MTLAIRPIVIALLLMLLGSGHTLLVCLAERLYLREVAAVVIGDPRPQIEQCDASFLQQPLPHLVVRGQSLQQLQDRLAH
jgi:hypothetical protein